MLLHDAVGQRQAQAGALPHRLGGEEGIEDARQVLGRDAAAGVGHLDPDLGPSWPVRKVMVPRSAVIEWAALTSRFMNTWLISEGRHCTPGSGPNSRRTSALYLISLLTMLSVE
jgi:hypothetical protein